MVRLIFSFFIGLMFFPLLGQKSVRLGTVVIDAGHGGKDPGAIGSIIKEKDVTLAVALKLGGYIKENFPDLKVVYTRSKDVFVPLDERAVIANRSEADLFISIHANWVSKPSICGTETFVLGLHRSEDNLEVAKKENAVIVLEENYSTKYEGFDPNSAESYIIFELIQNAYLDQSISFAKMVEEQFSQRAGRTSRGVKQAGFLVLRETAMPSVLVELGYLTNANEEQYLGTDEGRSILASAIFRAFREYKQSFDAQSNLNLGSPQTITVKPADKKNQVQNNAGADNVKPEAGSVVYRVQIATNPKPLPKDKTPLSLFDNTWMYKDNGLYKYTTGETSDFAAIKEVLVLAKQKIPDSFIVAFDGDVRISVTEAQRLLGK